MRAHYHDGTQLHETELRDGGELEGLLRMLAAASRPPRECYAGVSIESPHGYDLAVGLRGDACVLIHTRLKDGSVIEQATSLGDDSAQGATPFWWGDWTEVENRHLVPLEAGIAAAKEWLAFLRLSPSLRWTTERL